MEKILVCITPQSNSIKLIDRAAEEADATNGELHILNVQKGGSIFYDDDSASLLENLFSYGTKKGGLIHALAGDNAPMLILQFANKHKFTKIIVGEPPRGAPVSGVTEMLERRLKNIRIIVMEREE